MALITPSGGLLYHCRALRHRGHLWAPFEKQVEHWLRQWIPQPKGALVLLGPSAGHTLPWNWLSCFDELYVVEPDPLAKTWLHFRATAVGVKLRALHGFSWLTGSHQDLSAMTSQIQSLQFPPVLFCNVLGQLALLRQNFHDDQIWRAAFRQAVAPMRWASYHDRGSCHGVGMGSKAHASWETSDELKLSDAAARLGWHYPLVVEDHGTDGLFPPGLRAYALWSLTANSAHIIEWAMSASNN